MRRFVPHLLAFVLGIGAAGLAACGAKENPAMIPAANAEELRAHLDDVLAAIAGEDCGEARSAIAQVEADLNSLPSGTSVRLQEELRRGLETLTEQAAEECEPTETTPTETTTTETIPTTTTETTPTTPTTETVPTTPTETVPTTPTETTPTTTVDPSETGGVEVTPE